MNSKLKMKKSQQQKSMRKKHFSKLKYDIPYRDY